MLVLPVVEWSIDYCDYSILDSEYYSTCIWNRDKNNKVM
jgi:hypothetical protein